MNIELLQKLKNYPVIDKNFLKKNFGYNDNYAYLVLQRLEKKGVLKQVLKGKYTAIDDSYKIASNLYYPSYISFLTASMLKKCTEQIITTIQVVSNYNKSFEFNNYKFQLIKSEHIFGFMNQGDIFISTNEKLLIDMLLYRNYSGNFSEIIKVLENLEFDILKLEEYLRKISNISLIKRIGFLLEKYKDIDIYEKFELDNNYVFLDIKSKGKKIDSKWRIKYD